MTKNDSTEFNNAMASLTAVREEAGLNLQGKLYSMVKDRIEIFRRHFGSSFLIDTEVKLPEGLANGAHVLGIAKIRNAEGQVVASGHAVERVGSSKINSTNPIEMAETSAIGRALACFGLAGGEYASGDELVSAITKQSGLTTQSTRVENPPAAPAKKPGNSTGLYVPDDHDAVWLDPQAELDKVIKITEQISDRQVLGKYWADLEFFRGILEKDSKALVSVLKAAFVQRTNQLA